MPDKPSGKQYALKQVCSPDPSNPLSFRQRSIRFSLSLKVLILLEKYFSRDGEACNVG